MRIPKLWRSEGGNVSVLFGLSFVPVVILIGGATDIAQQTRHEVALQSALDASVLAAARSLAEDAIGGRGQRLDYKRAETRARDLFAGAELGGQAALLITYEGTKVKAEANWRMRANFLPLIGIAELAVSGAAEADFQAVNETCLFVTATRERGVDLHASSELRADCNVRVESSDSRAISATASSDIRAKEICSNGGTYLWATSTIEPSPAPCARPYVDPLGHLGRPASADAPCDYRDFVAKGRAQLKAGVYCGETRIAPASNVTLMPGEYVFRDGELVIGSGSVARGDDLLLYFHGQSAGLHVGHGSRFDGSGRSSGEFSGVLVYTDRDCESCTNAIEAGGTAAFDGIVYAPSAPLSLASHASSITAPGALVVVHRMVMRSSATLVVEKSDAPEGPSMAAAETAIIRLVK